MEVNKSQDGGEQPTNEEKDNPPAAPADPQESGKEVELNEDIDPRIVSIVGEENVKSAFGKKPEEDGGETDKNKEGTPPDGGEKEKEENQNKKENQNQEKGAEEEEVNLPQIKAPEPKPTRLDRRLANRYIRNLHLMGEKKIPTEEEVLADLKNYSKEEKIQALQFHLRKEKQLRGENPREAELDEEDLESIRDAERESVRQEIIAEENERMVMTGFISFVENHPELDESKGEYNPKLAVAVETLWRGGMPIDKAYETVTDQIKAIKESEVDNEKREKNKALGGVMSGNGQAPVNEKELDWDDVQKIQEEDPQLYNKMLAEGKFKHLM